MAITPINKVFKGPRGTRECEYFQDGYELALATLENELTSLLRETAYSNDASLVRTKITSLRNELEGAQQ